MEVVPFVEGVPAVGEYPYAPRACCPLGERHVVDIDVAKPFPSIVFRSVVLLACVRRVDADPSIVVGWRVVDLETNGFLGHGFQNFNRFPR